MDVMTENPIKKLLSLNGFNRQRISLRLNLNTEKKATNEKTITRSTNSFEDFNKDNNEDDKGELFLKFQGIIGHKICYPDHLQQTTHFSDLPLELVLYIMGMIACFDSDKLTVLNQCAAVCRGWYLCARDPMIYRQKCSKLWSTDVKDLDKYGGSWRRMLIERPHVLTFGCYVATMDKIHSSEKRYYYFRFFPGGYVLRFASSICPNIVVRYLQKMKNPPSIDMCDNYTFFDNKISLRFNVKRKWQSHCERNIHFHKYDDYDRVLESADSMIFEILNYKSRRYGMLRCMGIQTICERPNGVSVSMVHLNLPQFTYISYTV